MADIIELTRQKFSNIAEARRKVTGGTDEYTVDEMPSVIEGLSVGGGNSVTLQEKTVTENGEVVPDDGYDGLSKVTVNVPQVPLYEDTIEASIYSHFNIDKTVYPYLAVWISNDPSYGYSQVVFSDNSDGFYSTGGNIYFTGWHWMTKNSTITMSHSDIHTEIFSLLSSLTVDDLMKSSGYGGGSGETYRYKICLKPSSVFKTYTNFHLDGIAGRLEVAINNGTEGSSKLQEKTVVENGEVTPDDGYYGLSKVTVNVPITNSVSDGYMVNFFNANGEVIQVHSAKHGYAVDKPLSYDVSWVDSNGVLQEFPMTIANTDTKVINAYLMDDGVIMESAIYEHFGINKSSYEWLIVKVDVVNNSIIAYFVPAPIAPGNNYSGNPFYIFSGNMSSAAQVYTVNDVEVSQYASVNIKTLITNESVYSTMGTLNIPFNLSNDVCILYANYTNEAIDVDLTNSYIKIE